MGSCLSKSAIASHNSLDLIRTTAPPRADAVLIGPKLKHRHVALRVPAIANTDKTLGVVFDHQQVALACAK